MKKMRKLNNKGFTLIELLAVIVILALIMVIAIPNVLSSINNSRISSIHSKAKSLVSWYSDTVLSEQLVSKYDVISERDINTISATSDGSSSDAWVCLGDLQDKDTFLRGAEIDEKSFVLNSGDGAKNKKPILNYDNTIEVTSNTCSAIRMINGKIVVVLVAAPGSRFSVPGKSVTYAYSGAASGDTN